MAVKEEDIPYKMTHYQILSHSKLFNLLFQSELWQELDLTTSEIMVP